MFDPERFLRPESAVMHPHCLFAMAILESALDRPKESAGEDESRTGPDARLGALLREDPHSAAPAIYDRFHGDVHRWVWRLLGADHDHDDVVQQVFVQIIRSAKQLREVERLPAWVYAITVNCVYAELRRREIRRLFIRGESHEQAHADLVREVEVRDLLLRAKAIVEKIPAKDRIVFVLHVIEGRTLGEIAELIGCSHATAKRRFASGNARFQKLLSRDPELGRILSKVTE
jgi:RNA polymerase sigma-70 factor, ECF subfamily